ncbi:MAG: alpha/beta hydrolase [Kibdelosporangium sp.]
MRLRRLFAGAVVCAALASMTVLVPTAAAVPEPTWTDCPPPPPPFPADPRIRCATLQVPLDYRAPAGRTIDIVISRIATAKPGLRRGILLHNGGGPGAPSLHLPAVYGMIYPREVLDRYDLIGFDPRGIGYSTPVTCGRSLAEYPADLLFPFPAPDGSITRNIEFAKEVARDCQVNGGEVLPHITTANTARDMDRIRVALGERKLSYNSGSYGSYLGAVYASLFADRSDRIVIDSNVDPNLVWHRQWALWDHGNELRFTDLASWLAERDTTYHLGATPAEIRRKYFELVARLDANPVRLPDFLVTGNVFRAVNRGYVYHTLQFPDLADFWVFVDRGGEPSGPLAGPARTASADVPEDNQLAALLAVTCGDAEAPRDIRHYRREVATNRARFPLMGGMGANLWPCAFWRAPVEPPVEVTGKGPSNILMVQTLRDPATPYAGALGMRRTLGQRTKMVTVDTGNHGAYDPNTPSCATREVHKFLETGVLPGRDLFCRADPLPAANSTSPMLLLGP